MHSRADLEDEFRLIIAGLAEWLLFMMPGDGVISGLGLDRTAIEESEFRPGLSDAVSVKAIDLARVHVWHDLEMVYRYAVGELPERGEGWDILNHLSDVDLFFGPLRLHEIEAGQQIEMIGSREDIEYGGVCLDVVGLAHARYALDTRTMNLTIKQVALLGDVAEQSVRNAIAKKDEGRLLTIPGETTYMIRPEDAVHWLFGRRGFRPTPGSWYDKQRDTLDACTTVAHLGAYLRAKREELHQSPEEFLAATSVSDLSLERMDKGELAIDFALIPRLARHLGEDPRRLIARATECLLATN